MSRSSWRSLSRSPHPRVCPPRVSPRPRALPFLSQCPSSSLLLPPPPSSPSTQSLVETGQGSLPSPELGAGGDAASRLRGKNRCPLQGIKPCSESKRRGTPNPMSPVNKEHVLKVPGPVTPKARGQDPGMGPRSSHSQEIHNGDPRAGR